MLNVTTRVRSSDSVLANRLAHYKIPRYVKVVDGFPMTVTGKVRKVEMRALAIDELGLQEIARIKHA